MTKKLYPKCLGSVPEYGFTARGYLLPCCFLDTPDLFDGDAAFLVKEKFEFSKVDSVDEILESPEWKEFDKNLRNGIGLKRCYDICGKDLAICEIAYD